jgi:gamma-glutamyltranspeptidase/glutathione hydrolase
VHVAQILNVVEHFNLSAMGPRSVDFAHIVTEAMKVAFADRARWLGDSDFVEVPRGLISKEYGASLAGRIQARTAGVVEGHGTPPGLGHDYFGGHTTHVSTADVEGNWVALTATINTSFGSKAVVPGTGVLLNNEMDDFVALPGSTNFFGLVGAEANAVAPHKRPLSSMSPTIVLRNGEPFLAVGAAGGPTIISQVVLALLRMIEFGAPPDEALRAPRFHHQWRPDELVIEDAWGPDVVSELAMRGHRLRILKKLGATQAVGVSGGSMVAVADPRNEGSGGVHEDREVNAVK